jgi:hypothetical protein
MLNPESLEPEHPPQYLDLSNYPDFETMQNHVAEAHSLFEKTGQPLHRCVKIEQHEPHSCDGQP